MFDFPPEDIAGVEDDWDHDSWELGFYEMFANQILYEQHLERESFKKCHSQ